MSPNPPDEETMGTHSFSHHEEEPIPTHQSHEVEVSMDERITTNGVVLNIQFLQTGKHSTHGVDYPLAIYDPPGERIDEHRTSNQVYNHIPPIIGKVLFSSSLNQLRADAKQDERIDLTTLAMPERYRFIDCVKFVEDDTLQLLEFEELPLDRYAAISHVWKSLPPNEEDFKLTSHGVFLVECENRNDSGPISIDVLRYICLASLEAGVGLLWLDRLCILQAATIEGKKDKRWQILHMYDIYKGCRITFVVAAGLMRFPMKSEETEWIERAWTFQEVMVAPVVKVLYTQYIGTPPEIFVHSMHIEDYFAMQLQVYDDDRDGSQARRSQFVQALNKRHQFREPTSEYLGRFRDVWEYVQWRISARSVDVVFSVMGLLGVTLDPAQFGKEDRLRATVAIAQALLLKDDSRNTCIDIPLWRRISRSRLDAAREMGVNYVVYMGNLPTHVRLLDLEQELDSQPLHRFESFSQRNIVSTLQADHDEEPEEEDVKGFEDLRAVIMGNGDDADREIRAFLASTGRIDSSVKSRRKAERARSQIPPDLLRKAYNTSSTNNNSERILFKRPHSTVMELCSELFPSSSAETHGPHPHGQYVFGWSVQHILNIRLGRFRRVYNYDSSRSSAPVPVLTFFKFSIDP
ncbi:hypothetical protein ABKN59_010664 [Abortiporus biennis]